MILDLFLSLMLGFTIFYCYLLNNKINLTNDNYKNIEKMANHFDNSILRAEIAIEKLHNIMSKGDITFDQEIVKAMALKDDLTFMMDRAENILSRLEHIPTVMHPVSVNKGQADTKETGESYDDLSDDTLTMRPDHKERASKYESFLRHIQRTR